MPLLDIRDLLAFPAGDNSSDTVINGVHLNQTALKFWNYTLYSNNTLSNESNCYLIFNQYKPDGLLTNGTFINATDCYVPILPLRTRARLGAIFASLFAASILFTLINLKKHGQQFLREDKQFRIVGRRWQWYWMLIAATCGIVSCVTGIDVDRDYLQDLAIILQCFFFVLMGPCIVAAVWEGVRHWGSWQERQIVDRDPFSIRIDGSREKTEFYLPLIFYLWTFMSFFLTVPRSWGSISKQRSIPQQATIAKRAGTDLRFKIGAIFLCLSWFTIIYSLRHSIHHYKPHSRTSYIRYAPPKFVFAIIAVAVRIAYGIAITFVWNISLLKYDASPSWAFALGYTPAVLILIVFNVAGFMHGNEDKIIIQQRVDRGRSADRDMGLIAKPSWWQKGRGRGHAVDDMDRLRDLVADENVGTARGATGDGGVELNDLPSPRTAPAPNSGQSLDAMAGLRSRSHSRGRSPFAAPRSGTLSPTANSNWMQRRVSSSSANTLGSAMTGQTLTGETARPQVVRSMLDV